LCSQELPTPHPIETRIPQEYFGDVIMILEFMDSFKSILPVKNFFPYGITFELIERGLVENEVAGECFFF
jgi:bromodomain adjacent to zinc finger domain protein 1A